VTLFVKGGDDEYISVATNVPKADKSGPAIGTVFPKGEGLDAIEAGKPSYGEVAGGKYVFGSEPIRDASGAVLGSYSVGYLK
jgi:hypothetical protein